MKSFGGAGVGRRFAMCVMLSSYLIKQPRVKFVLNGVKDILNLH